MSEILAFGGVVPLEEMTPNEEFDRIVRDSMVSDLLKEISRFRIWRMRKNGSWQRIVDQDGVIIYNTWEEVVNNLAETLDCGRQQIYDRVRTYEQLHWLGYTESESIEMVAKRPYLYTKTLDMVLEWNQREEQPKRVLIPQMANASEEQARDHIRGLLEDVDAFDKQKDALKYVSETVLAEPQVEFYYDGNTIRCTYFKQVIDEHGNLHTEDYGIITFYPDDRMPGWAQEKLEKAFRSIGRYKEEAK